MCPHEDNPPAWLVRYHKRILKQSGRDSLYYCPYKQVYKDTMSGETSSNDLKLCIGANDPGEALIKAKQIYNKNARFVGGKLKPSERLSVVWGKPFKVFVNRGL